MQEQQERLKKVIINLNLNIPESVFHFDLDRNGAKKYLDEHPEAPFIVRKSSVPGYFTMDIPCVLDKTKFRYAQVASPNLNETEFTVGAFNGHEFVTSFGLIRYLQRNWKPHYKCMIFDEELATVEKQEWAQFKLRLQHNQENKIAVLSTQSLDQQKIVLAPEELQNHAEKYPNLQKSGDGHTGFAMALALNAPFVVVRSDKNRDESNAVLQKHIGDNGVIVITGHGSPGGDEIQGKYDFLDLTKKVIERPPEDIVSTTMDAGLKSGNHINVLLCICYGALNTDLITGDTFAHKLAKAFAIKGISSTILASDKPVLRFGTNAIQDNAITFNDKIGMAAKDMCVFDTKVDGPNPGPYINVYRPDEAIQLRKNSVCFLNADELKILEKKQETQRLPRAVENSKQIEHDTSSLLKNNMSKWEPLPFRGFQMMNIPLSSLDQHSKQNEHNTFFRSGSGTATQQSEQQALEEPTKTCNK